MFGVRNNNINLTNILVKTNIVIKKTALIWAAENGHYEYMKSLLDNGADINILDNNGKTTLIWAAENNHTECVKLLLDNGANISMFDVIRKLL